MATTLTVSCQLFGIWGGVTPKVFTEIHLEENHEPFICPVLGFSGLKGCSKWEYDAQYAVYGALVFLWISAVILWV